MTTILSPALTAQIAAARAAGETHVSASISAIEAMAEEIERHRLACEWAHPASAPYYQPVLIKQADGIQMVATKTFTRMKEGFFWSCYPFPPVNVIGWRSLNSAGS